MVILSGCFLFQKPNFSNPYMPPTTRHDRIKITAPLYSPFHISENALEASNFVRYMPISCVEDVKYEEEKSGDRKELRVIFSNAWKGEPDKIGELNMYFDFTIDDRARVYLGSSNLVILDGPNGNDATTVTLNVDSSTITRTTSYVDLKLNGQTYFHALKISLSFDSKSPKIIADYYFIKNVGLVKFMLKTPYNTYSDMSLFEFEMSNKNLPSYEINPAGAELLYPTGVIHTYNLATVTFKWNDSQEDVHYDIFLFTNNGLFRKIEGLSATSCDVRMNTERDYFWTVRVVKSNGLSTISKYKNFLCEP